MPEGSPTTTLVFQGPSPETADAAASADMPPSHEDMSKVPGLLDHAMEEAQEEEQIPCGGAFRPSILKPGNDWQRWRQSALLAPPKQEPLGVKEQEEERYKAFDLLDRLTKSGLLPVLHASLHVLLAPTHCFDASLMDTIVQDSCDPLAPLERSATLLAAVVHGVPAEQLVKPKT
jgi:hypothetical protein